MDDREIDQRFTTIEESLLLIINHLGIIEEESEDETTKTKIRKKPEQP